MAEIMKSIEKELMVKEQFKWILSATFVFLVITGLLVGQSQAEESKAEKAEKANEKPDVAVAVTTAEPASDFTKSPSRVVATLDQNPTRYLSTWAILDFFEGTEFLFSRPPSTTPCTHPALAHWRLASPDQYVRTA